MKIKSVDLFIDSSEGGDFKTKMKLTSNDYDANDVTISPDAVYNNVQHISRGLQGNVLGEFRMKLKIGTAMDYKSLAPAKVEDMLLLLQLGK